MSLDKNIKSTLEEGETMKLSVSINPESVNNKDLSFSSSEPTIASVDDKGVVRGLRPGLTTITITARDNGKKIQHKIYVSKTIGYLTKQMLEAAGIDECNKIMIVAHPDDETLWGGGHLLRDKYFILCLTNSFNEVRKDEFYKAIEYIGAKGIILSYPDLNNGTKSNWEHNKEGVRKDVDMVLGFKEWETIATHSPIGETGHRHHKFTSKIVTKSAKALNKYNFLSYFGKFYEKGKVPETLQPSLTEEEIMKKNNTLEIYKAEMKSIDAFWRQMVPFEYWKKASVWKKD
ncbi:MAG: Ig-like domain-containing protein [Coprobacillus cateniformis]|uniref:Ig-like domain-containing protein n=1 Tax=Coprobacillus cateniformis TaxID=100884 RepID=UPI0039963598